MREGGAYTQSQPSGEAMGPFKSIMICADHGKPLYKLQVMVRATYLRIQGRALKTEMIINTLVMIPVAITAGC